MKKTLVLVGGVVLAALLAVSCGSKKTAEVEATEVAEEVVEVAEEEVVAVEEVATVEDDAEMLSEAQKAGLAKCECYNSEEKTVNPDCVEALLKGAYAKYADNQAFLDEMDKTYKKCAEEKLAAVAKEAAVAGANKAAEALSNKLKK